MAETKALRPSRLKAIWQAAFGNGQGVQQSPDGVALLRPSRSAAGKTVTSDSALELAAVWACVRLLSETVGTLPFMLYRTDAAGNRKVATDDPLYRILHSAPCFDFTAVEFWEGVVLSLCLGGNSYAQKEMIGDRLVALHPMRADRMSVVRTQVGAREYHYRAGEGLRRFSEDEIFHVRGFGGAGDVGLSPVAFARQSIGSSMAADEFAGSMWANGARPSGILTYKDTLTPEQREQVRENILPAITGSGQAGGVVVLEADFKFQPITMTLEDAQFVQTRAFNIEEICRWFRVPPFMIGHTEKTSSWGTGLEQQLVGFLTFALRPYLARIEQAVSRSLIRAGDRDFLKPEFKVEGLLRTDSAARSAFYAVMVQNGIMTRNEVRRLENLDTLPGGDDLTVQSQNVPLGSPPPPVPPSEPKGMGIADMMLALKSLPAPVVNVDVQTPDITVNSPAVKTGPVHVDINTQKQRTKITEKRVTGYDAEGRIIAIEERDVFDADGED